MLNEWCDAALEMYFHTGKGLNDENEWHKRFINSLFERADMTISTGLIFMLLNAPHPLVKSVKTTLCFLTTDLTMSMS